MVMSRSFLGALCFAAAVSVGVPSVAQDQLT